MFAIYGTHKVRNRQALKNGTRYGNPPQNGDMHAPASHSCSAAAVTSLLLPQVIQRSRETRGD
eukprot:scaffold63996_cov39-Attheya_sp.AAC.2